MERVSGSVWATRIFGGRPSESRLTRFGRRRNVGLGGQVAGRRGNRRLDVAGAPAVPRRGCWPESSDGENRGTFLAAWDDVARVDMNCVTLRPDLRRYAERLKHPTTAEV
jgi:hypothetical protein